MQRCVARRTAFICNWKYAGICRCGQTNFLPTLTCHGLYYFHDFGLVAAGSCGLTTGTSSHPCPDRGVQQRHVVTLK